MEDPPDIPSGSGGYPPSKQLHGFGVFGSLVRPTLVSFPSNGGTQTANTRIKGFFMEGFGPILLHMQQGRCHLFWHSGVLDRVINDVNDQPLKLSGPKKRCVPVVE